MQRSNQLTTHSRNSCTTAHCTACTKCHRIRTFPCCNWCIRPPADLTPSNTNYTFAAPSRPPEVSSRRQWCSWFDRCPSNRCYCGNVPIYSVPLWVHRCRCGLCCSNFWIAIWWFCLWIRPMTRISIISHLLSTGIWLCDRTHREFLSFCWRHFGRWFADWWNTYFDLWKCTRWTPNGPVCDSSFRSTCFSGRTGRNRFDVGARNVFLLRRVPTTIQFFLG